MRLGGFVLALVLLTVPATFGLPVPQNDAGSGGDAPDVPSPSVTILSGVAYTGQLTDGDFHDWYAFTGNAGDVVQARVAGGYGCWEIARGVDDEAGARCATAPYVEAGDLEVTLDTSGTWYFHYENVPADAYGFSIGINEPAAAPLPGSQVLPGVGGPGDVQDDAGSGGDAPNTRSDDVRIVPGVVYDGLILGIGLDANDWYAFDASAGQSIEVKSASVLGCMRIYAPDGTEKEFSCNTAYLQLTTNAVVADQTGTWYLEYGYIQAHPYRFSLGLDAPAPTPGPVYLPPFSSGDGPSPVPTATAWRDAAATGEPLTLDIDGQPVDVRVWANTVALPATSEVLDADGSPVDVSHVTLLAGEALGHPGSTLRVALIGDAVEGELWTDAFGHVQLAPSPHGATYAVSPAVRSLAGGQLPAGPFDDESPTTPRNHQGACLQATPHRVANPLGVVLGWPERTLDISFSVDDDFVARYGALWPGKAMALVNALDGFYENQNDLRVSATDIHSHASSQFTASDTSGLLSQMDGHYAASHATLDREIAHLFTGIPLSGVVGQANCIGGAGDPALAYTVARTTPDDPINFLGLVWFDNIALKISAHELGHILSAHHHYSNCASERLVNYDPFETFDACTLMINDVGLASMQFSTTNKLVTRGWSEAEDL